MFYPLNYGDSDRTNTRLRVPFNDQKNLPAKGAKAAKVGSIGLSTLIVAGKRFGFRHRSGCRPPDTLDLKAPPFALLRALGGHTKAFVPRETLRYAWRLDPVLIEYLKICRIDHWLKNIFIVFGHAVALVLYFELEPPSGFFLNAFLSLIPACFVASAYYILNEILDAPFDALHPAKKLRGIPAGKVKVPILWGVMAGLLILGFGSAWFLFENKLYFVTLAVLMFFALLYNIPPVRLKDKAFLDVISESINNPLRLLLGWYAVLPATESSPPPLSIILAWWFFGALLMTGKRYSEYRFIGDNSTAGRYRKSFKVYNEERLVMAMICYACFFCFCTGIAMAVYDQINNLVLIFPMIMVAILAYFRHAMREESAKLEPEQLLRNPWIIATTALTGLLAAWLLISWKNDTFDVKKVYHLLTPPWEASGKTDA